MAEGRQEQPRLRGDEPHHTGLREASVRDPRWRRGGRRRGTGQEPRARDEQPLIQQRAVPAERDIPRLHLRAEPLHGRKGDDCRQGLCGHRVHPLRQVPGRAHRGAQA